MSARSRTLIYLQDPEDQKVAKALEKLHFVSKVQDWFAHIRWTPNLGPRCSSGHNHWWRDLQHVVRKCPFLSISYFLFLPNKTPSLAAFRRASWRLFLPSFLRPHSLFLSSNPVNYPAHIAHIHWQATRITNGMVKITRIDSDSQCLSVLEWTDTDLYVLVLTVTTSKSG